MTVEQSSRELIHLLNQRTHSLQLSEKINDNF